MVESHKRTIARSIGYRLIAFVVAYLMFGLTSALIFHIIMTMIHYIYERVWLKINWGIQNATESEDQKCII